MYIKVQIHETGSVADTESTAHFYAVNFHVDEQLARDIEEAVHSYVRRASAPGACLPLYFQPARA